VCVRYKKRGAGIAHTADIGWPKLLICLGEKGGRQVRRLLAKAALPKDDGTLQAHQDGSKAQGYRRVDSGCSRRVRSRCWGWQPEGELTRMLNSMLNSLLECEANLGNLMKDMVGPWGLEPQTSTVSKSNQEYKPTHVDPDLFLFTMRCRRVT